MASKTSAAAAKAPRNTTLLIATRKGLWSLTADAAQRADAYWAIRGPADLELWGDTLTSAERCRKLVAVSALAQEGHPLTGTWTGDWGPANGPRTHLTLVMSWDGDDKIGGVINPGPDAVPMQTIAVTNFTNWTVRIEAEAKDASGSPVRIQADGKIEELGELGQRFAVALSPIEAVRFINGSLWGGEGAAIKRNFEEGSGQGE